MSRLPWLLLACLLAAACDPPGSPGMPTMIAIPAGTFVMGAGAAGDSQQGRPAHRVAIAAFRISETDVTFDQYDRFCRATGRPLAQDEGFGRRARPVINLTRADMLAYIGWLNRKSSHGGFRLPSEAEWEYAAKAGSTTPFYWGGAPDPRFANSAVNKPPDHFATTAPVKSFLPNHFGLYDMAGNVWQEVADCLHPDYAGAPSDGRPWMEPGCAAYMVRGGSYQIFRRGLMTTARAGIGGGFASMSVGFRVAQDQPAS